VTSGKGVIDSSVFVENSSSGGAAVYVSSGEMEIVGSHFAWNTAGTGGAVLSVDGALEIVGSTFTRNSAAMGVVFAAFSSQSVTFQVTIRDSLFDENIATAGIAVVRADLLIA